MILAGGVAPGEGGLVSRLLGEVVELLGVHPAVLRQKARDPPRREAGPVFSVVVQGAGCGGFSREAGVGQLGHPQRAGVADGQLTGQAPQTGYVHAPAQPGDVRHLDQVRTGVDDDVVAVSGQLVVVLPALQPDVHAADPAVGRQAGEEVGVDDQFFLQAHGLLDRLPYDADRRGRVGAVQFNRRAKKPQGPVVAHVAHEHRPAGSQQAQRLVQHLGQVVGAGEVLGHRVQHDGIEPSGRQPAGIVGGLLPERHPSGQRRDLRRLPPQPVDHWTGHVGAPIRFASGGECGQQQPGPHTDLQDPARAQ
ncbi:hypothetical protein [Actinomadura sp. KC216]|uniref:hypothetical protein n=1 Tax=Actinomadura sp. KC216 TaxID=2530370 RepID=UPI001FB7D75D|nr:hypothetical protein [Actinomadura sp. KC216]